MGRSYKIDIVAPPRLKGEHHSSQLFLGHTWKNTFLAYIVVLAKDTAQAASSKENSAAAA
jgi:hypothetical protein